MTLLIQYKIWSRDSPYPTNVEGKRVKRQGHMVNGHRSPKHLYHIGNRIDESGGSVRISYESPRIVACAHVQYNFGQKHWQMLTSCWNIHCGIIEFADCCITVLVMKAENDWRDVGRPQVVCVAIAIFCSLSFIAISLETLTILPCDCEAYARSCDRRLSVCLSVRPSDKCVHGDKTK